ncbi:hypothetical protein [Winogradskyella sp. SYSU M77433]|uniref:hypothetical protein n=1 Tax=Winogradskyella sp. SYSU M77433 TaxID=3042722 RepID=UPI00247FF964|nr:hypothetical protein [Winogradskyella sp. SYSU M77433]MDH7913092.1 hypothetical protein [Winogradskyella sp. SYSU M77433]
MNLIVREFKKLIFLIGMLLFTYSCQKESINSFQEEFYEKRTLTRICLPDFKANMGSNKDYLKLSEFFDTKQNNKGEKNINLFNNFYLSTDEIIMIESENLIFYTFKIETGTETDEFYNLVIATDDSNIITSKILEYIPSNNWLQDKSQPFNGQVQIHDNSFFSTNGFNELFTSKSNNQCVTDVEGDWVCTGGYENVPNPPGTECQGWDYFVTIFWGPCDQTIDAGDSNSGGYPIGDEGGTSGGGGQTPNDGNDDSNTTVITSPIIQTHLDNLTEQTKDSQVKNRLQQMEGDLDTSVKEQGSEFRRVANGETIGEDVYSEYQIPESQTNFSGTYFPQAQANSEVRVHMHHNNTQINEDGEEEGLSPVFSMEDVFGMASFYKDVKDANSGTLSRNDNISSVLVSRRGLYALRVTDVDKATEFNDFLTSDSTNDEGQTYIEFLSELFEKNVIKKTNQMCESCTDAYYDALFERNFKNFFKLLDTGLSLFVSYETDENGNYIWTFLTN